MMPEAWVERFLLNVELGNKGTDYERGAIAALRHVLEVNSNYEDTPLEEE